MNSAPSQGGAEDEDDIPDMADFEEADNIEIDPVSAQLSCISCE